MSILTIILIGIGLSMDALAVSVATGFAIQKLHIKHAVRLALFFGLFQALMPAVGWVAGVSFQKFVAPVDHWIAFGLLGFIGGKMIYESFTLKAEEKERTPPSLKLLLVLSVATSIDALAVGITFAFLDVTILMPVLIIGGITFVLCLAGVYVGDRVGHFFESRIEIVGGLVLIGIGIKILVEHLFFQ